MTQSSDDATQSTPASAAFEELMMSCFEPLARYARVLSTGDDAEDLVQETYLSAFRAWRTFDMTSDPRRWLFAICRHSFFRQRQRSSRITTVDSDDELDALLAVSLHKATVDENLDDIFNRIDLAPAIDRALQSLSDPHRVVVAMVDLGGLDYAEAAEELNVPIGTIRSRLFRARRLLQVQLIDFARDAGFARARQHGTNSNVCSPTSAESRA